MLGVDTLHIGKQTRSFKMSARASSTFKKLQPGLDIRTALRFQGDQTDVVGSALAAMLVSKKGITADDVFDWVDAELPRFKEFRDFVQAMVVAYYREADVLAADEDPQEAPAESAPAPTSMSGSTSSGSAGGTASTGEPSKA